MVSKIITPCNNANHVCDKVQYNEASFFEKIKLNIHLMYCKACRKYTASNIYLTRLIKKSKTTNDEATNEVIFNCLGKLPAMQAEVFRLKTMLDYKTEDICNEFNITTSNFWAVVSKARDAMANCLKKNSY